MWCRAREYILCTRPLAEHQELRPAGAAEGWSPPVVGWCLAGACLALALCCLALRLAGEVTRRAGAPSRWRSASRLRRAFCCWGARSLGSALAPRVASCWLQGRCLR